MGPVRDGGLGPTAAVLIATFCVALLVVAMVWVGGGFNHPIVTAGVTAPAPAAST